MPRGGIPDNEEGLNQQEALLPNTQDRIEDREETEKLETRHVPGGTWLNQEAQINEQSSPALPLIDLMEAIKATPTELATKLDLVAIDVNRLRVDLRGVADCVTTTETNVGELQQEMAAI
ncbi:hypothetical protein NDU88_002337 [Pleurodeles waltl]|uniref:Uncharacterized protein n=1 Tax=Pleurodeles waltl TaxID=8319 RepID=A0AAV7SA55_PLEWA|nr:hypothetical protein NDU88_002337 [Pleurodeles waltl]